MYTLEVFDGNEWEQVAEFFESAEDAELYYNNQLGGFRDFRITGELGEEKAYEAINENCNK